MSGLWAARRDGTGCDCDISLFETAMNLNMYVSTWHLSRGYEPERFANSAHPSIVPFQNFADARRLDRDRVPEGQVLRAAVRGARPRVDDLATRASRRWRRGTSTARPASTSSRRCSLGEGSAAWLERLRAAGIPCGPGQRHGRRGRRSADAGPRPDRRDRASRARHRAPDPLAAARRRAPDRAARGAAGAASTRARCWWRSAATRMPRSTGWRRPASSATSRSRRLWPAAAGQLCCPLAAWSAADSTRLRPFRLAA